MAKVPNASSVLAGNSRLSLDSAGIVVEPQLAAFRQALAHAVAVAEVTGALPQLSIAFDHRGTFRKQFLSEGLTNSQKRHPCLSQLHPEVVKVFSPTAQQAGVSLDDVQVIHEDSAKSYLTYLVDQRKIPGGLLRHVVSDRPPVKDEGASCSLEGGCNSRISCAAITSEYFRKAACIPNDCADELGGDTPLDNFLEVFFENDPWSSSTVYVRGVQLAHQLRVCRGIRLNLVVGDDRVISGKPTYPQAETSS